MINTKKYLIVFLIFSNNLYCNEIIPSISNCPTDSIINCNGCRDVGCTLCRNGSNGSSCNNGCFSCPACPNIDSSCADLSCLPDVCPQKGTSCDSGFFPRSIFIPRSIGANTARELVAWQNFIHRPTNGCSYITWASTFGYNHSYRPERIARYLFGNCILRFAGSQITNRSNCEILADNFGLSTTFRGNLRVCPEIQNYYLDNQIFVGLDNLLCGLYFRIHAPLAYTIWNLNMKANNFKDLNNCKDFPQCYMADSSTKATCDINQALSGDFTFGNMQTPWEFGKFCCKRNNKFALADVDLILGYDIFKTPLYHIGVYAQAVMPTGNKPKSRFIFEPIVGNAKHFEFGGGISAHALFWQPDADQSLGLYLEANVTHMFANRQCRSFDFCRQGHLSRYLLLKEYNENLEFSGNLINAINVTTIPSKVSINVKGDVSLKLAYRYCSYAFDLGYNFYGNSKETLRLCKKNNNLINTKKFGIKGNQGTCALVYNVSSQVPVQLTTQLEKINLNSTSSNSTINCSGAVDNPNSINIAPNSFAVTALSAQSGAINAPDVIQAFTSNPPQILTCNDLDLCSGVAAATATHKIFGYMGYEFIGYNCKIIPYAGIGAEVEFDALACFEQTSLNQWGIWIKAGIAF